MLSAVPLGPPIYIHPTAADFYNTAHRADSSSKYVSHLVFYLLNFSCLLYFFSSPHVFVFLLFFFSPTAESSSSIFLYSRGKKEKNV
jgi:hypothetical protein